MIQEHAPNLLQSALVEWLEPNENNCRLFVEKLGLRTLEKLYTQSEYDQSVILPDIPIVRFMGYRGDGTPRLVILAGERRITAARNKDVRQMLVRVVSMSEEDAYRFILQHNTVARLTTLELAFRAWEMDRLGFSSEEIGVELGGVATYRYIEVGRWINPDLFTDDEKLCDPSIVQWYEAARFGNEHFQKCFTNWNRGIWDEKECAKRFRKRGSVLPLDNAEKGFRVTFDVDRFVIRGQADLALVEEDSLYCMLEELEARIRQAKECLDRGDFGPRKVFLINPTTVPVP